MEYIPAVNNPPDDITITDMMARDVLGSTVFPVEKLLRQDMCVTFHSISILEPGVDTRQRKYLDTATLVLDLSNGDVSKDPAKRLQVVSIQPMDATIESTIQ